ncbi:MAG: lysozyme [Desulfovibrio sp.]|jgi:lysozyme|nr:lysozyme [Desulfovibrio sp.]
MASSKSSKFASAVALVAAVVGIGAASIIVPFVAGHEGEVLNGYLDPVGVATKCYGDTHDVTVGKPYTRDECLRSLADQLVAHAEPVLSCTPCLAGRDKPLAAAVSLAYNIGTAAYCKSSVARYFNAGEYERGCRRISEIYTTAGGKELPGLVRRRKDESDMCLQGLKEGG